MISHGDELGRTQRGNNNAYCQDNELSWYDWALDDERRALLEFAGRVFGIRRAHPVFRQRNWPDLAWRTPDGHDVDWSRRDAHALAVYLDGCAIRGRDADGRPITDSSFLLCLNAYWEPLAFTVPDGQWRLVVDTADPDAAERAFAGGGQVTVQGRALVLLRAA
jgi:glycogen operon protein